MSEALDLTVNSDPNHASPAPMSGSMDTSPPIPTNLIGLPDLLLHRLQGPMINFGLTSNGIPNPWNFQPPTFLGGPSPAASK